MSKDDKDKELKKYIKKSYDKIIRPYDIILLNDQFLMHLIGKNIIEEFEKDNTELIFKKKYIKYKLFNTSELLDYEMSKLIIDINNLVRKYAAHSFNKTEIYNIFSDGKYFLYFNFILKFFLKKKMTINNINILLISSYSNLDIKKIKDIKYKNKLEKLYNVNIKYDFIEYEYFDKLSYDKKSDTIYIKIYGIFNVNTMLYKKILMNIHNIIIKSKLNKTFIIEFKLHELQLINSLLMLYCNIFDRVFFFTDKYRIGNTFFTLILYQKKINPSDKFLLNFKKDKYVYKIFENTNKNYIILKKNLDEHLRQLINNGLSKLSLLQLKDINENDHMMVEQKLNIYKNYYNIKLDIILGKK